MKGSYSTVWQDATWDSGGTRAAYDAALDPDCAPNAQMSVFLPQIQSLLDLVLCLSFSLSLSLLLTVSLSALLVPIFPFHAKYMSENLPRHALPSTRPSILTAPPPPRYLPYFSLRDVSEQISRMF